MSSGSDRFPNGDERSTRHAKGKEGNWSSSPRNSPRSKQRKPEESDAKKAVRNVFRMGKGNRMFENRLKLYYYRQVEMF